MTNSWPRPAARSWSAMRERSVLGIAPTERRNQLWQASHGIVFAPPNATSFAPPRRSCARFHSASAVTRSSVGGAVTTAPLPITFGRRTGQAGGARRGVADSATFAPSEPPRHTGHPQEDSEASHRLTAVTQTSESKLDCAGEASSQPTLTALDYRIPDQAFRKAKEAKAGTPESFWSLNLYRGPDNTPVRVHYCRSLATTERVMQQYFMKEPVIGLDLEWLCNATPTQGARKNVSLIQLASPSRVALFHLAAYPFKDELVAPSLKMVLEDPDVTKAGVWIKGDCSRLRKFLDIHARGIFELSHLYRLVKYCSGEHPVVSKKLVSLATQVEECLLLPLFKGQDVRSGDWSQPLNMSQTMYSSSDAYACVQLYAHLDKKRQQLDPTPPLPFHAELDKPIRLTDGATIFAADEAVEEQELEPDAALQDPVRTAQCPSSPGDRVRMELEADDSTNMPTIAKSPQAAAKPAGQIKQPRQAKPSRKDEQRQARDPKYSEADNWALEQRVELKRASHASLRTYYLWHSLGLNPDAITYLLRDPPLAVTTVRGYVLEAIKQARLPFEKKRLREEVIHHITNDVCLPGRYRTLMKACEGTDS